MDINKWTDDTLQPTTYDDLLKDYIKLYVKLSYVSNKPPDKIYKLYLDVQNSIHWDYVEHLDYENMLDNEMYGGDIIDNYVIFYFNYGYNYIIDLLYTGLEKIKQKHYLYLYENYILYDELMYDVLGNTSFIIRRKKISKIKDGKLDN